MLSYTPTRIIGTGQALGGNCITNQDLVDQGMETSDEWIQSRSGITQRYVVQEGQDTFTMALEAAEQALQRAAIQPEDIDLILVATCTPAQTFPSTASRVQGALGCKQECFVLDVNAACSGFIHAYLTAQQFMNNGNARTALVIGAETFSNVLDFEDRSTAVLFGDGAGAVVLQTTDAPSHGLIAHQTFADGTKEGALYTDGGPGSTGDAGYVQMNGREVFKNAVHGMSKLDEDILKELDLSTEDIDWVIPHQANKRIIEAAAKAFNIPMEKVVVTVDKHANTSAATIPLALNEAMTDGRVQSGDLVLFQAFGAGFVWSWALLRI